MKFTVYVTAEAEEDVVEIGRFIAIHDSAYKADQVDRNIYAKCLSLESFPARGHVPPELKRVGVNQFLEIHFKPYRIIYQIDGKQVFIHAVLDGRRDNQDLLERRLIR